MHVHGMFTIQLLHLSQKCTFVYLLEVCSTGAHLEMLLTLLTFNSQLRGKLLFSWLDAC